MKNFAGAGPAGETVLCVEIPEGAWGVDEDFAKDPAPLLAQLREADIVRGDAPLLEVRQVFERRVPVIIHTAGARDCVATARMFQDVFDLWMILSHGTFDGHWAASALARRASLRV